MKGFKVVEKKEGKCLLVRVIRTKIFRFQFFQKFFVGDKVEWAWEEQETLAKQLWALHYAWWDPQTGPVLQRAYKMLRELKIRSVLFSK